MNKIKEYIKSHPALINLVIFLLMIVPALLLFTTVQSNSKITTLICLGLVILANLAAVFPIRTK